MFGTPATQNQTTFGFGTPTVPQQTTGGFQFNTPTSSASSNLFGTTGNNLNFKPGAFGLPPQNTGLFGTPASTSAVPGGSLTFGSTSTAPTNAGLGFGTSNIPSTTTSNSVTGVPFGASASTMAVSAPGIFSTSIAPTNSTFGTSTSSILGLSSSTTPPNIAIGGNLFGTSTTYGLGPSSSTTPTLGTSTTAKTTALNFGLGGNLATTSTSTGLNFNSTSSAPATVGLGGLASSQTKTGAAVTIQKEVPPKEQPLPNEILQTVEQFKEVVKLQKLHSSDIARCSIRDFRRVEQEIDLLNNLLNDVEYQLQKNRNLAEKLKYDTAKCLQNVEMAQRTQDTPPGLQYENTAPLRYFLELANQFEREMQSLKTQIEIADKYVKNHRNPDILSPQDLALGMRRLHETFVALAGRLQSVHSQVESQKESYLNIHKQIYNDSTNPFEKLSKPAELNVSSLRNALIYSPPKVATGPTPFNKLALGPGNLMQHQNQATPPYQGNSTSNATSGFGITTPFGTQMGHQASMTSLFGNTLGQTSSTNFQLQKPPTGNKRGKQ